MRQPGSSGLSSLEEVGCGRSPNLLSSERRTAAVTGGEGGGRVHACVCKCLRACGLLSFLCGRDHPCSVETESPHVGLHSSPMGIGRPSGGGESRAHHVRDPGRLSLRLWGASSLFLREDGASKALAVTLTLVVGVCLFPKTRERGEEGEPPTGTGLHSRIYQKMSL